MSVDTTAGSPKVPDRFQVKGELGRGGMAVVYHAFDTIGERDVALKFLPATDDERLKKRFQREAVDLAGVYHKNVVEFYALGESGGQEFIEMEFVGGGTLSKFQRQCDSLRAILEIYAQVCEGLDHIHGCGLVHRDIKPANILMTEAGEPKISDLGLARKEEGRSQLTQDGTVLGTASYLSPEQLMSHAVGPSSDIYAMGVCLFEAVTCRPPFRATSMLAMLRAHLEEKPPKPSDLLPGLPESIDNLVLSLLEKKPDKRPSDLVAVAAQLRAIAGQLTDPQDTLVSSSPEALLGRARLHLNGGDPTEALRILDDLEDEGHPELKSELLCERARLLLHQGDPKAPEVAQQAVEECRANKDLKALGQALVVLGQAATKSGDWDGALSALQEARELVPSNNLDLQVELMESLADLHTEGSSSGHPGLGDEEARRFRDIATGLLKRRDPDASSQSRRDTPAKPAPKSTRAKKPQPKESESRPVAWKVPALVGLCVLLLTGGVYMFLNRPAKLEIVSEPGGARVTVNGEDFVSPYSAELKPGDYNIAIYLKGYHGKKEKISLAAGETRTINAGLEPSSGGVKLTSKPSGAKVFLNGQARGETPVELSGLEIKKYKVKLKKEGYKPHEESLEVLGGKTRNLEFALTKVPPPPPPPRPTYSRPRYTPPPRTSGNSGTRPAYRPPPTPPPRRPTKTYRPPRVNIPRVKFKKPKVKFKF